MTAAAAQMPVRSRPESSGSAAHATVVAVLVLVALLGMALLLLSLLPSATLAGRLLGAAGQARAGAYAQDLNTYIGQRMRLAAGVLLMLVAGLVVFRAPFERLVRSSLDDLGWPGWPAPRDLASLGVALVLAVGLRLAFLNQPMRYDEALTFNEFASRPLYYGLSFYPDPNNHLLNTLLMHLLSSVLGNQPWVLRLPALLGGLLLVPATYSLARLLYGSRAALLSALLVAASSYLIEYSTNGRGYTLQALCFVTMLGLLVVAIQRDSPSALLLAALVAAVGAYALPTMLYGVAIAVVWLALKVPRARPGNRLGRGSVAVSGLVLGLAVSLLYLPVILISGADKLAGNRFVVPLDPSELARELPVSLARTWAFWNRDVPSLLVGFLLIGFLIATVADIRARRWPLGLVALAVCLLFVLVQRVAPFERVWLFLLPLYLAIASAGLVRLVGARVSDAGLAVAGLVGAAVLALATFSSGSILSSGETGTFPDAEAIAQSLRGRLQASDAVVTEVPASLPELQYYFPRAGLPIETLVRSPAAATQVYAVTPPGVDDPRVQGWRPVGPRLSLSGSTLFELERVS